MSRFLNRRAIWLLLFTAAATLALAGAGPEQAARAQQGEAKIPCDPVFERKVQPLKSEEGGTLDVEITFDYNCRSRSNEQVINVMLVVADNVPEDFNNTAGLERNLRAGLSTFINQLPWENGSRMGLVLYNSSALVRSPLRQGEEQRQALLGLADRFRINRGSNSLGFDAAIFQAYKQLPTQVEGEVNIIVAFDSGADPFSGAGAGCRQSDRVGVIIAGIQIPEAGGRMSNCMNFSLSSAANNNGDELEERFEALGKALFKGDDVDQVIITDYLDEQYVAYIPGSSRPVQPVNVFGGDWEWTLNGGRNPPGGRSLTYQLKVSDKDPGLFPAQQAVSYGADAFLIYSSGIQFRIPLHTPEQCLARAGMLVEDCDGWTPPGPTATATDFPTPTDDAPPSPETPTPSVTPETPTPIVTPDTPTPSVTPTAVTPTPSVTPTATSTPTVPPPAGIYLPFLVRDHTQGS